MSRRFQFWILLAAFVALPLLRSSAALVYVPGEGWYYESAGQNAKWTRTRAKDQLEVAEQAFTNRDYTVTLRAARRVLKVWPLSDYAPRAGYLVGRALEADRKDEAAFNAYETVIQQYPAGGSFEELLWRQYGIANRYLAGQWFKLWGFIPIGPSMDDTARLFSQIVTNGPYSDVAPHAQMRIGAAREKQKDYDAAVRAYEIAADRYHDQPLIASDAIYRQGLCYQKQAATAEYDQSTAGKAIAAYTDFMTIYPDDKRVPEVQKSIVKLKAEQVRGNFMIAQFYEKSKTLAKQQRYAGAIVYYNAVLQLDPNSTYAPQARQRIEALKPQLQTPAS